jgi:hypothetical protein
MSADLIVTGNGGDSVFLLRPVSEAGHAWCAEHIPEDSVRLGDSIAVEHRFILGICEAARGDGLTVRRDGA